MKFLREIWIYTFLGLTFTQTAFAGPTGNVQDEPAVEENPLGVTEIHELKNPLTATSTTDLIASVGKFLIEVSTALLIIFILWGAFLFMTSGGSPERVEKGKKTIFWAILGFVVLLVAGGVGALVADILGTPTPIEGGGVEEAPVTSFEGVIDVLGKISQWMFGILITLSIIMVLYSAFLYVFSMGSEDRIKKAKDTLMYAIIAVAIAVFAGGVGVLIQNLIGSAGDESSITPGGGGGGGPNLME